MTNIAKLTGQLAIVTGAADGIGRMLAEGFAGLGMQVGVLDIRGDAAEATAKEIGKGAFALQADVSDRDSLFHAADDVAGRGAPVSVLWVNAGSGVGASFLGGKPNTIEWAYSVNVLGMVWTAQAFTPLMETAAADTRHIGFTASTASLRDPGTPLTLYGATKQAAFGVAEAIRNEVAEQGIPSTILCPGLLNTNIWDGARARPDRFGGPRQMDPAIATRWREAKSPQLMWPHITRVMSAGGGYLVCNTEPEMRGRFNDRAEMISAAFVDI